MRDRPEDDLRLSVAGARSGWPLQRRQQGAPGPGAPFPFPRLMFLAQSRVISVQLNDSRYGRLSRSLR
jgi:hypothetical protein